MEFLESIYNSIGFNEFLEYDFRPFILKTFLFSAVIGKAIIALKRKVLRIKGLKSYSKNSLNPMEL